MSVCRECSLDHRLAREEFSKSLFLSDSILMGFNKENYTIAPSPTFHLGVCNWVQNNIMAGNRRLLVMLPRDHLKTSMLTEGVPVWVWTNNPQARFLVMHRNADHAVAMNGEIQSSLRAWGFRHYYPELLPDIKRAGPSGRKPRWTTAETELNRLRYHRDPNLTALGINSTLESIHVHGIILDDLVERKAAASAEIMTASCEFLDHMTPLLEDPEEAIILIVGTWWPGGFYEKIVRNPAFKKLILGCYQDERSAEIGLTKVGEPIWSERFSRKLLESIRSSNDMGEYAFSHQYLNIPISKGSARFKSEDLRDFDISTGGGSVAYTDNTGSIVTIPISELELSITVDPSYGGDDFAITLVGHHPKTMNLFLLDWFAEPVTVRVGLAKTYRMAQKWDVWTVGVEQTRAQELLGVYLDAIGVKAGRRLHIVPLKHGNQSKPDRILGFQPFVEAHRFFLKKSDDKVKFEMLNWNPEGHNQQDNILDSLAYHRQMWKIRRGPKDPEHDVPEDIKEDRRAMRRHKLSTSRGKSLYGLSVGRSNG